MAKLTFEMPDAVRDELLDAYAEIFPRKRTQQLEFADSKRQHFEKTSLKNLREVLEEYRRRQAVKTAEASIQKDNTISVNLI